MNPTVKLRLYCPSCGEVRHAGQHRPLPKTGRFRVHQHDRTASEGQRAACPGGIADPEGDRAP